VVNVAGHEAAGTGAGTYEAAGQLLRALAAPIRVAIVTELAGGERCVHELVDRLGVSQPLVSQHLRVLRGAGLVRGSRRGREIAYALVDEHIAHIVADAVSHAGEPPPLAVEEPEVEAGPVREPHGSVRPSALVPPSSARGARL
jgi:DNA-binding transcriptional ArsR family regulator